MSAPGRALTWGRRVAQLAAAHPNRTAIIHARVDGTEPRLTWGELNRRANAAARRMRERGVDRSSLVVVATPNGPEHFVATIAAWRLGACVLPVSPHVPPRERDAIVEVARARLVVGDFAAGPTPVLTPAEIASAEMGDDAPLPDVVAHPGKAVGSGGSTGRPKVIVDPRPWVRVPGSAAPEAGAFRGFRPGQIQLVPGALHHNTPFSWSHIGLFEDHTLVLMERFDAARAVDLIERHGVEFLALVPTMMRRMLQVPDVRSRDFRSVEGVFHTGAPCPPWVKRGWIDLVGGERLYEGFGSSEAVGAVRVMGDEWLERPGTLGRPSGDTELRILDDDGRELPPGEVGEIAMRRASGRATYFYLGSPPARTTPDGFVSVGDMGWLDADGYLYLADRRVDLIISGGANVYPAEVEAALSEHPDVADVVVIGVPDEDWGKRVHALVLPADPASPPRLDNLDRHCRARLAPYKVPKSYEFVAALPRDEAGKIRRSALAAEREEGWTPAMRKPMRPVGQGV